MRRTLVAFVLLTACGGPPAFPEQASIDVGEVSANHVAFTWPAANSGDVAAYVVRIDGEDVARLDPHVTEYGASELPEATEHRFEVVAVSPGGEESTALRTSATTLDGTAPAFEAGEDGLIGDVTPIEVELTGPEHAPTRSLHLSWPAATDAVGVVAYEVRRGQEEPVRVEAPTTEVTLEDVPVDAPVELAVIALDEAGNASEPGLSRTWSPPAAETPASDDARLRVEAAQALVEQMLLGALSSDQGALSDVLAAGAVTNPRLDDVMAQAEGVGVATDHGIGRGGGGRVGSATGGLGGLRARRAPDESGGQIVAPVRGNVRRTGLTADTSRPALSSIFDRRIRAVQSCYERGLRSNPELAGQMVVRLQILAAGRVQTVTVTSDTVGDATVSSCVSSQHRRFRFAEGADATVDVTYAMSRRP